MRKRSQVGVPTTAGDDVADRASSQTVSDEVAEERAAEVGTRVPGNVPDPGPEGGTVEVTWGEEQYQPASYMTFRVGPFKISGAVRPGESVADATVRIHRELDAGARRVVAEKSAAFLRDVVAISERAGTGRR